MASKKKKKSNTQNKSKSLKKSVIALCVGVAIFTGTQTISNNSNPPQDTPTPTVVTEPAKVAEQPAKETEPAKVAEEPAKATEPAKVAEEPAKATEPAKVTEQPTKVDVKPTEPQYTTKIEVAQYICDNNKLPPNYVSKNEAMRLYEEKTGKTFTSWNFNPLRKLGIMIGGDTFGNREKKLPQVSYKEADVDYFEVNRGKNRLIYAKNCNIYHTNDHYQTFTKLNIKKSAN